jgi:hypothetical protein
MSSAAATEENYLTEITSFMDLMYGDQEGYIYVPTKHNTGEIDKQGNPVFFWQPYFFRYPKAKIDAATHLLTHAETHDCYIAPSIFKAPNDKKGAWKGSNYVWIEFDGNAPKVTPDGIPAPTVRIQSSNKGHEHWYWRLSEFCTDRVALEGLSKRLTYTLDADKSGWDCSQVLRPPGTVHQESRKRVRILKSDRSEVGFGDFRGLVEAPESVVVNTTMTDVPDIQDVIAKYKWDKEALNLFKKPKIEVGKRSSAMTRLAFECVEMGMTNEETYAVLFNADERWGKYKSRSASDRARRLIGLITHCRSKKEVQAELRLSDRESFISLGDFRNLDLRVDWLYEGFLTERGLGLVSAAPGVGKSTLSIRMGLNAILGKPFLKWTFKAPKAPRVGFVSLEMAGLECKQFIETMWPSFTPEEREQIDREFFLLPLGYSLAMGNKDAQQFVLDEIDKHDIKLLIIDSLKAATGLDERAMDKFFEWVNKYVRNDRGCTVWLVHHNRKPANEGPRKPRGLEDLYGDTFIGAHPTTVISLWKRNKFDIEVLPFKIRLAPEVDPFVITRAPFMDFALSDKLISDEDQKPATEGKEESSGRETRLFG